MSDDAQAIIDTATQAVRPVTLSPGEVIGVAIPEGGHFDVTDLERFGDTPRRKRGIVGLFTAESFANYANDHKVKAATALYADTEGLTVVGVLNGHARDTDPERAGRTRDTDDDDAGWGDHRCTFTARTTPEWDAWSAVDGKRYTQTEFAEFIEDHVADIVTPPAADVIELVKYFEATAKNEFKSAIRLSDGTRQLQYVETVDARAGQQGSIVIPETIDLGLVPFEGAEVFRVRARFRYRIESGGVLKLGIVLDRPDLVIRAAFDSVLEMVENTTELVAYRGLPPA